MSADCSTGRPTRIVIERVGDNARASDLAAGEFLTPRRIDVRGRHVQVALVGHAASLLAGDALAIEVDIAPGTHLELIEPSGTVAYNARGGRASWTADVRVGAGASLVWKAAPFVVAGGACVDRRVDIALAEGAVALLDEMVVLGRSGEVGGALFSRQRITLDGRPLLVEDLDFRSAADRSLPGVLGGRRVLCTTMLLGLATGDRVDGHITPLALPGMLARSIAEHAHEASDALAHIWAEWHAAVMARSLAHAAGALLNPSATDS